MLIVEAQINEEENKQKEAPFLIQLIRELMKNFQNTAALIINSETKKFIFRYLFNNTPFTKIDIHFDEENGEDEDQDYFVDDVLSSYFSVFLFYKDMFIFLVNRYKELVPKKVAIKQKYDAITGMNQAISGFNLNDSLKCKYEFEQYAFWWIFAYVCIKQLCTSEKFDSIITNEKLDEKIKELMAMEMKRTNGKLLSYEERIAMYEEIYNITMPSENRKIKPKEKSQLRLSLQL